MQHPRGLGSAPFQHDTALSFLPLMQMRGDVDQSDHDKRERHQRCPQLLLPHVLPLMRQAARLLALSPSALQSVV
jgi:hypothetical protein